MPIWRRPASSATSSPLDWRASRSCSPRWISSAMGSVLARERSEGSAVEFGVDVGSDNETGSERNRNVQSMASLLGLRHPAAAVLSALTLAAKGDGHKDEEKMDRIHGRYWIRTSDPFRVKEVRYRCANRPLALTWLS